MRLLKYEGLKLNHSDVVYTLESFESSPLDKSLSDAYVKDDFKNNLIAFINDAGKLKTQNSLIKASLFFEIVFYLSVIFSVFYAFYIWGRALQITETTKFIINLLGIINFSLLIIHFVLLKIRYINFERYIQKADTPKDRFDKRSITFIGFKMTKGGWIEKYENNVTGLVYFGAGLLVVVVGLRGMGDSLSAIQFPFPPFIIDESGAIKLGVILMALMLEFTLLVVLSLFTYFKRDENGKKGGDMQSISISVDDSLVNLKDFDINKIINNFEVLKEKIVEVNTELKSLNNNVVDFSLNPVSNQVGEGVERFNEFNKAVEGVNTSANSFENKVASLTKNISVLSQELKTLRTIFGQNN